MQILRITNLAELQPYGRRWDELAGDCVFRSWTWLSTWWQHYGEQNQLFVLLVVDSEYPNKVRSTSQSDAIDPKEIVAILPCYIEASFVRGRVLRLLGDGEVCSDHLDLLVCPNELQVATEALAKYLNEFTNAWDAIEFSAIEPQSTGLVALYDAMSAQGCLVTLVANESVWSVPLPDNWEAFLALQSKSHRKQLRRLENRVLNTHQAVWHLVKSSTDLEIAWPILTDLHQRRRRSLGEAGCFASRRWSNFHRDVAKQMLSQGKLRLSWLEISGQPAAAEYHFAGLNTTWAYQGGLDPDRLSEEPGRLSMIRSVQHALAEGHQQLDLLRGDEQYKAHWRAEPTETFDLQIVPARSAALWRSEAGNYLQGAARLARQFTNMLG